jgi:hypothetical protein
MRPARSELKGTMRVKARELAPTLVNGATMPKKQDLPEDIQPLVRRNAVEITDTRWDYDVGRLVENVERALAQSPRRKRFLEQFPPWDYQGFQWIEDDPPSDESPPR